MVVPMHDPATPEMLGDIPVLAFVSQETWKTWLESHYDTPAGIWMKFAKKQAPVTTVTYTEALEIALCYGWIDGQVKRYDESFYLQKFTPRRPKSIWSKVNVQKATALIRSGAMQPVGLAAIEAAKKDGRWERAYDSSSTITIPPDFQASLEQDPQANEFFATLTQSARYAFLWRLQTTVKPELRATKIANFVQMLHDKQKLHD